jgi:lysyl oxidase
MLRSITTALGFAFFSGACSDHGSPVAGDGGTPCNCPDAQPCVDHVCMPQCPSGQTMCGSGVAGELGCCGPSEQCCTAAAHGYSKDVCAAAGAPCPVACAPGKKCDAGSYCQYDPPTDGYICTDECSTELSCGDNICCPLGSQCVGLACPLPDLTVDADFADPHITQRQFAADSCALVEGCVDAAGMRTLLTFNTRTPNLGPGDLHLGSPEGNPLFVYSPCHGHYHFQGYANYTLLDLEGNKVAAGHKQAFCLIDLDCPTGILPIYNCTYQGIQAGCADIYSQALDCQWIDVTDVPSGQYRLIIELNYERRIAETDYTNDRAEIPVVVCRPTDPDCDQFSSCPGGCSGPNASCCVAGDPCGWANDGECDCDGTQTWDDGDCAYCTCP